MSMEDDDDMFAAPSAPSGAHSNDSKSLYRVMSVGGAVQSSQPVQGEQEMMEKAAKHRIAKSDLANKIQAQDQSSHDKRRSNLYDDADRADYEDDVDNVLDITGMGMDSLERGRNGAKSGSKRNKQEEYTEILPGERIEPLNMKDEMRKGEVNVYGQMRKKRRHGQADEDDPTELAVPSADGHVESASRRKRKAKQRQGRLTTGDSSDSDDSDDDAGNNDYNDDEENEELNESDAWLAEMSKKGEIYEGKRKPKSSVESGPSASKPAYLKDVPTALKELQSILQEGPSGETVLRTIKRLTPATSNRLKKAKSSQSSTPSTSTEEQLDQEEATKLKKQFEKCVALADFLLDSGVTTIYESTYEMLSNRLEQKRAVAADEEVKEVEQGDDNAFWQYKWTPEAPEVFGPFDSASIKAWASSFAQFTNMVIRGAESPATVAKKGASEGWMPFEPILWS